MNITEKADAGRLMAVTRMFPKSWGTPPFDDEERRAWILTHARAEAAMNPHRELARRDTRLLNELRLARLEQIRECP
ncbi:hypothetical protein GCM10010156_55350 [Planobispora rosea]|uniref:Uncharacterized protein n=1 Tax=Planobispora rosea TaxID=35762 RepID=A0A8J3S6A5_PLARO|nr:hypothetical protein GCM10010156_55350 [Planobispora rosea]GIH86727.1 hypothetical protein Pro02_51350 [Planobispora rosea]